MTPRRPPAAWEHLGTAWRTRPTLTAVSVMMVPVGLLVLIAADAVSITFAFIGAPILARVMGAAMLLGGTLTIAGCVRRDPPMETIGMVFTALGVAIHLLSVTIVLGVQGLVIATMAAAVLLGSLQRTRILFFGDPAAAAVVVDAYDRAAEAAASVQAAVDALTEANDTIEAHERDLP